SYDKAKRFSEAVTTYRQAVALGEQSLPSGHPLTLSCMESFSQMLRRDQRIPEEAQKLEDRIKQLRAVYRDPSRITRDRLKALEENQDGAASPLKPNGSPQKKPKPRETLTRLEALEAMEAAESLTDCGEPLAPSVSPNLSAHAKTTLTNLAALEASGAL